MCNVDVDYDTYTEHYIVADDNVQNSVVDDDVQYSTVLLMMMHSVHVHVDDNVQYSTFLLVIMYSTVFYIMIYRTLHCY